MGSQKTLRLVAVLVAADCECPPLSLRQPIVYRSMPCCCCCQLQLRLWGRAQVPSVVQAQDQPLMWSTLDAGTIISPAPVPSGPCLPSAASTLPCCQGVLLAAIPFPLGSLLICELISAGPPPPALISRRASYQSMITCKPLTCTAAFRGGSCGHRAQSSGAASIQTCQSGGCLPATVMLCSAGPRPRDPAHPGAQAWGGLCAPWQGGQLCHHHPAAGGVV